MLSLTIGNIVILIVIAIIGVLLASHMEDESSGLTIILTVTIITILMLILHYYNISLQ